MNEPKVYNEIMKELNKFKLWKERNSEHSKRHK